MAIVEQQFVSAGVLDEALVRQSMHAAQVPVPVTLMGSVVVGSGIEGVFIGDLYEA